MHSSFHYVDTVSRFVDLERETSVDAANQVLDIAARELGLRLDYVEINSSTVSQAKVVKSNLIMLSNDSVISQAMGKGVGDQAYASAGFEAFEHAAAAGLLPLQKVSYDQRVLQNKPFRASDLLYEFAHQTRSGLPQQTVRFHRLNSIKPSVKRETLDYPRMAVDYSCASSKQEIDLNYLNRNVCTTGYAAGTSLCDSLVHALNETVERDALSSYLLSAVTKPSRHQEIINLEKSRFHLLIASIDDLTQNKTRLLILPSVAGVVVLAYQPGNSGYVTYAGMGCSNDPLVAVERAVTELLQEVTVILAGATWQDEGGSSLSMLDKYPRMKKAAMFPNPLVSSDPISYQNLRAQVANQLDHNAAINQLHQQGFNVYFRLIWEYKTGKDVNIFVSQVLVPGLERFNNIFFGRSLLPTGRLYNSSIAKLLRERKVL